LKKKKKPLLAAPLPKIMHNAMREKLEMKRLEHELRANQKFIPGEKLENKEADFKCEYESENPSLDSSQYQSEQL
jgi:hypothetical protein